KPTASASSRCVIWPDDGSAKSSTCRNGCHTIAGRKLPQPNRPASDRAPDIMRFFCITHDGLQATNDALALACEQRGIEAVMLSPDSYAARPDIVPAAGD